MENFIIIGSVCIVFGIINIIKYTKNTRKPYEIVQGQVIELKESIRNSHMDMVRRRRYYTPIFEYMYNDKIYRVEHNVSTSYNNKPSSHYTIGQNIEIRVYKDNPDKGVQNISISVNRLLYAGIMGIVIGVIFITIFILVR